VHTQLPGQSLSESGDGAPFGNDQRAADDVIRRYRSEPAALLSLLAELGRLAGPLSEAALGLIALKLRLPAQGLLDLARAHHLLGGEPAQRHLGLCCNGACAARGGAEVERILAEKGIPYQPQR